MASTLSPEVVAIVKKDLENAADRGKRALVAATKETMGDYYSFPEGRWYERTGMFGNAYTTIEKKNTRNANNMSIKIGVAFDNPVDYPVHGISNEEIYEMNLSGEHGWNGNSGDVVERVERAADIIAAFK